LGGPVLVEGLVGGLAAAGAPGAALGGRASRSLPSS